MELLKQLTAAPHGQFRRLVPRFEVVRWEAPHEFNFTEYNYVNGLWPHNFSETELAPLHGSPYNTTSVGSPYFSDGEGFGAGRGRDDEVSSSSSSGSDSGIAGRRHRSRKHHHKHGHHKHTDKSAEEKKKKKKEKEAAAAAAAARHGVNRFINRTTHSWISTNTTTTVILPSATVQVVPAFQVEEVIDGDVDPSTMAEGVADGLPPRYVTAGAHGPSQMVVLDEEDVSRMQRISNSLPNLHAAGPGRTSATPVLSQPRGSRAASDRVNASQPTLSASTGLPPVAGQTPGIASRFGSTPVLTRGSPSLGQTSMPNVNRSGMAPIGGPHNRYASHTSVDEL